MLRSGNRYRKGQDRNGEHLTPDERLSNGRIGMKTNAAADTLADGTVERGAIHQDERDRTAGGEFLTREMELEVEIHREKNERRQQKTNVNMKAVKTVILVNTFLYAVCFWIQTGVLPYLSKKFNMDMVTFGYLQTFFSGIMLVGGPIYGRFGDIYGGRAALGLAYLSAAAIYGILGVASSSMMIFVSRIPSLFLHAYQGTQMVISDLSDESGRTEALGRVSMCYSIGIVVGPLIGGWISVYMSEQSAAAVACIGSCISLALTLFFIPSNTKPPQSSTSKDKSSDSVFSIKNFTHLMRSSPGAAFFLSVNLLAGLPGAIFSSMFALIVIDKFQLTADENGYFLSFQGIVSIVVQGMVIGRLTKKYSEMKLLRASAVLLAASYMSLCLVQDIWQLAAVLLPMTCGNCITTTVITSVLTKAVPSSESGTILGLTHAGTSLLGTLAPIIGAELLTNLGFPSLGITGAVINMVLLLVLTKY
ncbi:solute carrier family 22 member 18-like [Lytechinus variegatus]|uniref:solute carrier family 22 member 18-like n=1 Tax=Lytechinus variegatus TaxID=7654 RepID=UPI001BB28756|nr:solute carrier family 22 member 18-like [Lytechinus variegatus]